MQESALSTIALPVALAIIMLGLGLHLRLEDFKRILFQPKAIAMGLLAQALLLPALCFFICKAFGVSAELSVGLMLLAASPGGTTANLFSHLFKGDVALNISLTAINSVLAIVTIPTIVNFALSQFMGGQAYIPLQFQKTMEVIALVLAPVAIGMFIHAKLPSFSKTMDKPVKIASSLILVLLIVSIVVKEWVVISTNFQIVGAACLVFNLASLLVGYLIGKTVRLTEGQNRAIAFEIGVHNGALAIYLALVVLKNGTMSLPAAVYSLLMYFTATAFGWWVVRKGAGSAVIAKCASSASQR
ncbi:bile acid:sodium symporter family protein [Cupriavidus sp. D39]|uniref:bile acid:sodium symporter family protein n=1 Tax=Cupriavidus sp. D39 TaxID=2997877 RepID=UPI00226E0CC9|nr:bile acid:sodium symporter family protein [Cupriavidus sp. D39]MCY0855394.1 bile acid:sodium symporter family protein [Cupriavidus sp. D39]